MDFKLRSGSKATVSVGLDELLLSEFQEQVPALDFPEGRHPCLWGRLPFQGGTEHAKVRSDLFHFYIRRQKLSIKRREKKLPETEQEVHAT